jgi:hypothetical protein
MIRTAEADAPPFPFSGSIAFIGGSAMVKRFGADFAWSQIASGNRSEPLSNLFATPEEAKFFTQATGKAKRQRRRVPA